MANNNFSTNNITNVAWMREIQIVLTSELMNSQVVFDNRFHISVNGHKYLSALKDTFTVSIDNIPYDRQVNLMAGQYFNIEIKAGYRTSGLHTIYKGSVLYMSNNLGDRKTSTFIILCTSKMVAVFGQSRMNLGLKSGINMYSALNYIFRKAGITNAKIDKDFKKRVLQESTHVNATLGSYVDAFVNSNNYLASVDESLGSVVTVWSPYRSDARLIYLNNNNILLTGGFPRLTKDGVTITLIPSITYMPGDTIVLDNAILNVSVDSKEDVYTNKTQYLDENGKYMIFELTYALDNRGLSFNVVALCKTRRLLSSLTGG